MTASDLGAARIRPFGEFAFLVEVSPSSRYVVARHIADSHLPGVVDVVPAERTVLVRYAEDPSADRRQARNALAAVLARLPGGLSREPVGTSDDCPEVVVPVRYDGPDLEEVATLLGRSVAEVVADHLAGRYTVAFLGFAPGFAYLDGLSPRLRVPRLSTPRPRVRAGAVGIAGERSCIYPWPSPGGWRIIGHTPLRLFDPAATPPTPLAPGRRVRFVAVEEAGGNAGGGGMERG